MIGYLLLISLFSLLHWIPQSLQHELSHAFTAKLFGARIDEVYPFPSRRPNGNFTWAHIKFSFNSLPEPWKLGIISLAPIVVSFIIMLILFMIVGSLSFGVLKCLLVAILVNNAVDSSFNLSTFYRKDKRTDDDITGNWNISIYTQMLTDGWRFAYTFRLSQFMGIFIAVSWKLMCLLMITSAFWRR